MVAVVLQYYWLKLVLEFDGYSLYPMWPKAVPIHLCHRSQRKYHPNRRTCFPIEKMEKCKEMTCKIGIQMDGFLVELNGEPRCV